MTATFLEHAAAAFEPQTSRRQWATPGDLARYLDPRIRQTPALQLVDQALVDLLDTPDGRIIITMPPQEGKSTRVAKDFPTWALCENPNRRIVTASYGQTLANRNGRAIRRNITEHPELDLRIAADNGAVHDWTINGHDGGVLSVGVGAGLTGRPADLLVIDDPIKDRKEADSEAHRETVWDWWTDVASTRLAPGAQVAVILTRWHEQDLAGKLLAAEDGHLWRVLNIPAQADHRPEKGESDPLGRQPGEFLESARARTLKQWQAIKLSKGARTWASLYQGRPAPQAGDVFDRDVWARYETPLWVERDDGSRVVLSASEPDVELVQSWDFTFKDTKASDYVVGQVWLRRGVDAYLLDQKRARLTFTGSCDALLAMTARWPQAVLKLVEDKANGPAILNALRAKVGGLVPVEPEGSKYARAAAVTPFIEARNVWLPSAELAPWVDDLIEEAAVFPNGAHDDQVDAMSQAVHRLLLVPILRDQPFDQDEVLDDEATALPWAATY